MPRRPLIVSLFELRKITSIDDLRLTGTFFTGSNLAKAAIEPIATDLRSGARVLDPACGVGDLLLACCHYFESSESLQDNLQAWTPRLMGIDICRDFARYTSPTRGIPCFEINTARHSSNRDS